MEHFLSFRSILLRFVMRHRLFDEIYTNCACNQQYACQHQHVHLMPPDEVEQSSSDKGGGDLRYTDGSVEQSQVSPHVFARNRIGQDSERHGKHGGPGTADQQIRDEQQIFVVEEQGGYETDATQYEAKGIGLFACLEQRQYHSPDD